MIHHITAICSDAQRTTDFYSRTLGLRLVKLTINQDDVGTYHLYFANRLGDPGTVLTFFPWSHLPQGSIGPGMVSAIALAAPPSSLGFWERRLADSGLAVGREDRFGETVLLFTDPDGLPLEIVGSGTAGDWSSHGVPSEYAISGFFGATLLLDGYDATAHILVDHFGFTRKDQSDERIRFVSDKSVGRVIDIVERPMARPRIPGYGTVHHIAFRASDDAEQLTLSEALSSEGLNLTPPIDRYYFKSVYFHEPGGVLFEIATDGPGFAVDEPEDSLGTTLVLPPRFEHHREEILGLLPPFSFPK